MFYLFNSIFDIDELGPFFRNPGGLRGSAAAVCFRPAWDRPALPVCPLYSRCRRPMAC
jgi:hypothetical protein